MVSSSTSANEINSVDNNEQWLGMILTRERAVVSIHCGEGAMSHARNVVLSVISCNLESKPIVSSWYHRFLGTIDERDNFAG